jgi:hypothetical protein
MIESLFSGIGTALLQTFLKPTFKGQICWKHSKSKSLRFSQWHDTQKNYRNEELDKLMDSLSFNKLYDENTLDKRDVGMNCNRQLYNKRLERWKDDTERFQERYVDFMMQQDKIRPVSLVLKNVGNKIGRNINVILDIRDNQILLDTSSCKCNFITYMEPPAKIGNMSMLQTDSPTDKTHQQELKTWNTTHLLLGKKGFSIDRLHINDDTDLVTFYVMTDLCGETTIHWSVTDENSSRCPSGSLTIEVSKKSIKPLKNGQRF